MDQQEQKENEGEIEEERGGKSYEVMFRQKGITYGAINRNKKRESRRNRRG